MLCPDDTCTAWVMSRFRSKACQGYRGHERVFTPQNVAALTAAAGQDVLYPHGHVFD